MNTHPRYFLALALIICAQVCRADDKQILWPSDSKELAQARVTLPAGNTIGLAQSPIDQNATDGSFLIRSDALRGNYVVEWTIPCPQGVEALEISAEIFKANMNQSNHLQVLSGGMVVPVGSNAKDWTWEPVSARVWPLPETERVIRIRWCINKPELGDIWRTGVRNIQLTATSVKEAREAFIKPLAAGLPPLADPSERKVWSEKITLRNGVMFKGDQPYFPIGFVFGLSTRELAQAKAMGCNAVHFDVGWNISTGPGLIPQSNYEQITSAIHEAGEWGLASFCLYTGHYIPEWFGRKYSADECAPLGNDGKKTGSWFVYSTHFPPFQENIVDFWKSTTGALAKEPSVAAVNFWNEPSYGGTWNRGDQFGDYSKWGIDDYRRFLKGKYKTIEALNAAHQYKYESWETLIPPYRPDQFGRAAWLEWMRYGQQYFADFFNNERSIIKKVAGDMLVVNKKQTNMWDNSTASSGTNWHLMNQSEDIFGINIYSGSEQGSRNILDAARSYAGNKPVIIFETNVMPPNAASRTPDRIRVGLWSQVLGGARGMFIFSFSDNDREHGLRDDRAVNAEARPEYVKFTRAVGRHQRELASPHVPAQVAVLYSTTAALQYTMDRVPRHVIGAFELLRNSQYQVDILPEERCDLKNLEQYKVLVLPSYCILSKEAERTVGQWVSAGGKVLAFGKSLATDEFLTAQNPPAWMGISERRPPIGDRSSLKLATLPPDIEKYKEGEVSITGVEMTAAVKNERDILPGGAVDTHTNGEVIAVNSDSYPAIVSNNRGRIVYCAFDSLYSEPLRGVIEGILRERMKLTQHIRMVREEMTDSGIMTSLRQDYQQENLRYLLAINTTAKSRRVTIELEQGWRVKEEKLLGTLSGINGNTTEITLPAREVFLFELKK